MMEDGSNYRKYLSVVKGVQIPTTEPTHKDAKTLLKKIKSGLRGENKSAMRLLHYNDALLKKVDSLMSPSISKDCEKEARTLVKDCDRLIHQGSYKEAFHRYYKAEIICPYSCAELKAKLIMERVHCQALCANSVFTFPDHIPNAFELIRDCKRVIALDPNNTDVYWLVIQSLMEFGARSLASACLTSAACLYDSIAHFNVESIMKLIQSYEPALNFHPYNETEYHGQSIEIDLEGQLNNFIERMALYIIDIVENKRVANNTYCADAFVLNPKAKRGQNCFNHHLKALIGGWQNALKQEAHSNRKEFYRKNKSLRDSRKSRANGLIGKDCLTDAVKMYADIINDANSQVYRAPKKYVGVKDLFKREESLDAEKSNLYLLRAGALILMKTFDGVRQAIRQLDKVLSLEASNDRALYWRAWCYHMLKKRGRAMRNCKACLKINPQHHKALLLLQRLEKKERCFPAGVKPGWVVQED